VNLNLYVETIAMKMVSVLKVYTPTIVVSDYVTIHYLSTNEKLKKIIMHHVNIIPRFSIVYYNDGAMKMKHLLYLK
jgi:hypothetical protein